MLEKWRARFKNCVDEGEIHGYGGGHALFSEDERKKKMIVRWSYEDGFFKATKSRSRPYSTSFMRFLKREKMNGVFAWCEFFLECMTCVLDFVQKRTDK